MGYTLFVRNKGVRHVELTKQGQAFIGLAHRWQAPLERDAEAALLSNEKSLYVASVGKPCGLPSADGVPDLYAGASGMLPSYDDAPFRRRLFLCQQQAADLAFITDPMYSSQVKTTILFREELCLVVGKDLNLPKH